MLDSRSRKIIFYCAILIYATGPAESQEKETVTIVETGNYSARIDFGIHRLTAALSHAGYKVAIGKSGIGTKGRRINVGLVDDKEFNRDLLNNNTPAKEGYAIVSSAKNLYIGGADPSGVLYGCLELASQIRSAKKLPLNLSIVDQPEMVLKALALAYKSPIISPAVVSMNIHILPKPFPGFMLKNYGYRYSTRWWRTG
jgi:hypothetical protein